MRGVNWEGGSHERGEPIAEVRPMSALGHFWGVGVGPGPRGLLPIAAVEVLAQAAVIYLPRARSADLSIARRCCTGSVARIGASGWKFR